MPKEPQKKITKPRAKKVDTINKPGIHPGPEDHPVSYIGEEEMKEMKSFDDSLADRIGYAIVLILGWTLFLCVVLAFSFFLFGLVIAYFPGAAEFLVNLGR